MGDLIRKEDGQYKKYEELLLKRDQLAKEAESIHIAYMREFGELLLRNFELKIECIRKKKMITYCLEALNHGREIDSDDMSRQIEKEMALYEMELKTMLRDKDTADKAETSTRYKADRAKRIYRRIAKAIHPDINPLTSENDTLRDLWERTVIAYRCNDDDELINLEALVRKAMKDAGEVIDTPTIDNLDERIENLEEEINDIITTEPYIYGDLLSDPDRVEERKNELTKEIEEYEKYSGELQNMLDGLLSNGEGGLTWSQV